VVEERRGMWNRMRRVEIYLDTQVPDQRGKELTQVVLNIQNRNKGVLNIQGKNSRSTKYTG